MSDLIKKKCVPCEKKGLKPFDRERAEEYMVDVKGWSLSEDTKKISREFEFEDFVGALDFVNKVGDIAEMEGHHPDIFLHDYKKVLVTLSTHSIDGLSVNDYIVAAKVNTVL